MTSTTMADTRTDISPCCVRLNRRLWSIMYLGQIAFTVAVLVALSADLVAVRVRLTPQLVGLDVMVLAIGVALMVLHRRYPEWSGDPAQDRAHYGRTILFPLGMLAAATTFGMVIVLLTGCLWPNALVPVASLAAQLIVRPH